MMFKTHDLHNAPRIAHGFFGRNGGVSGGIYASLNAAYGSDDTRENVTRNRAIIADALGAAAGGILTVYQHHSADCIAAHEPWDAGTPPKGDALVTDKPGLALGVLTADCAPVLFSGKKADGAPVIGAAHAGWGGALKGVIGNTVTAMRDLGAVEIAAVVGPCIGPSSYEVSEAFQLPFIERDVEAFRFFREGERPGHLMFDLPGYVTFRLAQSGITKTGWTGQDTYSGEGEYFSYRRATHKSEPDYGRQLSAILIRE